MMERLIYLVKRHQRSVLANFAFSGDSGAIQEMFLGFPHRAFCLLTRKAGRWGRPAFLVEE
jgi:hypothetical protein